MQKIADFQGGSVSSSNLDEVYYDEDLRVLKVVFKSGAEYEYYGVGPSIYTDLMGADSKGSYFYHNIRNRFPFKKV